MYSNTDKSFSEYITYFPIFPSIIQFSLFIRLLSKNLYKFEREIVKFTILKSGFFMDSERSINI